MHQDVQENVIEEINSIFPSFNDEINIDVINNLKYLDLVIRESMRLFPIAPIIGRKLTSDLKLDGRYAVPYFNFFLFQSLTAALPYILQTRTSFLKAPMWFSGSLTSNEIQLYGVKTPENLSPRDFFPNTYQKYILTRLFHSREEQEFASVTAMHQLS